jgi:hemolysin D
MTTAPTTATPAHPVLDLLARYAAIFRAAWSVREELAGPKRLAEEAAFLPAALALQATPPHPAPRRAAIAICAFFTLGMAWAAWGELDIVAVAPGRIVVAEGSKTIQPLEAGVVRRVLVRDGDSVEAGQVLVELDATAARADQASVSEQLAAAEDELHRATALLQALAANRPPAFLPLPARERAGVRVAHLQAEWQDLTARRARIAAELARRAAEADTVRESIAKLEATLPIARQREADVAGLAAQGFVNQHAAQDRGRERLEQERDLATQRARLAEAQAAMREAEQTQAAFAAETQRTLRERQSKATLERERLTQERSKTAQRERLMQLTAPVAGVVQQLAVHTEGGVVTPAQVLMVLVPKEAQVTAEVVIDNRDIGFVRAGQRAEVKLETFPFTRYGTVTATVQRVAADAVVSEQRGAHFPATLLLDRDAIAINGQRVTLAAGMNLSAEVKTGKRRVADYLLAPVRQAADESMKER